MSLSVGMWHRRYVEQLAHWGIKVISPPVDEQMTLAEARLHLRLDDDGDSPPSHPDDTLLAVLITAAREACEAFLGRSLAPTVLEIAGARFTACTYRHGEVLYGNYIELPMGPVNAVLSVRYVDDAGAEQTISSVDYVLDDYSTPPRLYAAYGVTWPSPRVQANAVKIRYLAGYTFVGDSPDLNPLPASLLAAMKLLLGHYYENRHATTEMKLEEIPLGVASLLRPYQLRLGMA